MHKRMETFYEYQNNNSVIIKNGTNLMPWAMKPTDLFPASQGNSLVY